MGQTNVAAAMAALLAGILIAVSLVARTPDSELSPHPRGDTGSHDLQAGYTVRGQAWATELFGRRYGRHLLAAVMPESGDSETDA